MNLAGEPISTAPVHPPHELAMLIVCPTCATTYQIQLAALGTAGRSVRCSHCKNTWFATADSVVEEPVAIPATIPPRRPAPPPAPEPEDFDAMAVSDFSVEVVIPPDPAAAEAAERVLAESDAP